MDLLGRDPRITLLEHVVYMRQLHALCIPALTEHVVTLNVWQMALNTIRSPRIIR